MSKLAKALTAAAGNAGGDNLYVEDVFSTYLYDGTGAAHTITNGIDLDGEGGLTWIKTRNTGTSAWHSLSDTERGAGYILRSDLTNAQNFDTAEFTSFNSDGFTVGNDTQTNGSGRTYASWTFRKAEKFFDVVTYTGNGTTGREIPHNLGSTPAAMFIKRTDAVGDWKVFHKSLSNGGLDGRLRLDSTGAEVTLTNNFFVSDTYFGSDFYNGSGQTYVAYLFASDAGGFGDDGSESIIKCGSFSGGIQDVDLGFEPQFLIYKRTDSTGGWAIFDVMRGMTADGVGEYLQANTSDAEASGGSQPSPIANGFRWNYSPTGETYIYIAIRRPMKTPESGTEVFDPAQGGASVANNALVTTTNFPVDMFMNFDNYTSGGDNFVVDRLRGRSAQLRTQYTAAEGVYSTNNPSLDSNEGLINRSGSTKNKSGAFYWSFKRATGFFDVVAYSGNGVAGHVINHNLGVAPEWIICKKRSSGGSFNDWYTVTSVYYNTNPYDRQSALNSTNGFTGGGFVSSADSTSFTMANAYVANENTYDHIAYLFASVSGVSKIGTYTGTGSDVNVDCGFSSGARFVYIQRADATGDGKYVWDSVRGIVAGNDPYLLLNSTAAEVTSTDYIDPLSSGFTVTSSAPAGLNASGGTYFFLAIA
jgi:hypothetical protein